MAYGAAETSDQESLDQFQGKRRTDHLSSQTEDIHIVIFNALMGEENVMDKLGTYAGNFVRGNSRSNSATAERNAALNLPRGNGPGQGDDESAAIPTRITPSP
jgi:hypothetical protein